MASIAEHRDGHAFSSEPPGSFPKGPTRTLPILSSAAPPADAGDPMDLSQPQPGPMGPPGPHSPNGDRSNDRTPPAQGEQHQQSIHSANGGSSQPVGAAAAAQQPKVVQTAFIHKLYNMLEDQTISHLISWSSSNESFVMSPSSEFSKVLAQYFKHTNISSFVRQLNMYGFHKVSDVFHTGSPDSPLWEFKHGAGNFKRGDLAGLREIKRRASRHTLIHRDSFSNAPKVPAQTQPSTPMETVQDPVEARLNMLEWNMQDVFGRLARTEEAHAATTAKCHSLMDGLTKSHYWNQELSSHLLTLVPDRDHPVHRDVYAMRQDISRHIEQMRNTEEPHESLAPRPPQFQSSNAGPPMEPSLPSMSPRQRPFDESRRTSLQVNGKAGSIRAAVPAHLQTSPRRYGSIGAGNTYSPTPSRPSYLPPPPPPQPQQHPLATTAEPPANLARRHTSADIRIQGWSGHQPPPPQYTQHTSPYASGQNSTAYPSSPRTAAHPGDQQLRDALAQYELPRASHASSRQASPPPGPHDTTSGGPPQFHSSFGGSYANPNDAGWQIPGAPRYPFRGIETSAPATRRSSMASNVHSLLNPADTAEVQGEDEEGPDERKRKRIL